jgi:hypothetical protein
MDRSSFRYACLVAFLAVVTTVLSASGCRRLAPTMFWLVRGSEVDPEFNQMEERRVAVVCRPQVELTYRNSYVARDIARRISMLLQQRGKKIEVIPHQTVAEWTDKTAWEDLDCQQLAEGTGADMVLLVDLHDFSIYKGKTLYQGNATVSLTVYDCADGSREVFHRELPPVIHPPNGGVDTATKTESEFRRWFVGKVADQIGRHFYPHDRYADYALEGEAGL